MCEGAFSAHKMSCSPDRFPCSVMEYVSIMRCSNFYGFWFVWWVMFLLFYLCVSEWPRLLQIQHVCPGVRVLVRP